MRKKRQKIEVKICFVFIILIISLAFSSMSYSHWYDDVEVQGTVTSACWDSCVKIRKTLEAGCLDCEDCFKMTIEVNNNGSSDLTGVEVTDTLGEMVIPVPGSISITKGVVSLSGKDITWNMDVLSVDETEYLTICLELCYDCCEYISAVVTSPADGANVNVPRYYHATGTWGLGEYDVLHEESSRVIKFEGIEPLLGDDGAVETDAFIIEALGGGIKVMTATKAGPPYGYVTLYGVGDEETDSNGFTLKLVSIEYLDVDKLRYNITVTSDNTKETAALSHVEFDFGNYCEIIINNGATITADSIWCDLSATTENIIVKVDEDGVVLLPELPYFTPWAWDCCEWE